MQNSYLFYFQDFLRTINAFFAFELWKILNLVSVMHFWKQKLWNQQTFKIRSFKIKNFIFWLKTNHSNWNQKCLYTFFDKVFRFQGTSTKNISDKLIKSSTFFIDVIHLTTCFRGTAHFKSNNILKNELFSVSHI